MNETEKICGTCKDRLKSWNDKPCKQCIDEGGFPNWNFLWGENKKKAEISFPILNNLTPTLESCTKKVFEEIGELMQLLGKGQGESGESTVERLNNQSEWVRRTAEEALDGAQSLVTLFCVLLDEPNDREIALQGHIEKLIKKEYLK